jgi:hypothetical protein
MQKLWYYSWLALTSLWNSGWCVQGFVHVLMIP